MIVIQEFLFQKPLFVFEINGVSFIVALIVWSRVFFGDSFMVLTGVSLMV